MMASLIRANRELYRRGPDESFQTLQELHDHCRQERQYSADLWQLPQTLLPMVSDGELSVTLEKGESVGLNDWSFSQMCRLTRLTQRVTFAADRAEADYKVAQLLSLALAA